MLSCDRVNDGTKTLPNRLVSWRRLLLAAWWITAFASIVAAQTSTRNVLLLNSFERHPSTAHTAIFRTELTRRSPVSINFFEVSIQPSAFGPTPQDEPIVNYLKSTVAGQRLDLVVSVGGPAAVFARKYRAYLFPTTPLLETALDARFLSGSPLSEFETAVTGTLDLGLVIDNLLLIRPETETIFAVIGTTDFENFWRGELMREFERFKGHVTIVWLHDLALADVLTRVAALPPHSAIFYLAMALDGIGLLQSDEGALAQIRAVASAPVLGIYDFQLGYGILGGPLIAITDMAKRSAEVALRLLAGEPPAGIRTPIQMHGPPSYDWRELQRWRINQNRLPANATVLFREPGLWEQYKGYFVSAALLVALQSTLIAALMLQRQQRTRAERDLRESEERFRRLANGLPVMVWTARPDTTLDFVNNTIAVFTGLPVEQLLDNGWLDHIHPDDVERCQAIYMPAVEARRPFYMEYRLRRPDGGYAWVLDTGVPRYEPDGRFAGYVGSAIDISERRGMEQALLDKQVRAAAFLRRESGSRRPSDQRAGSRAHAHRARSARRRESAARGGRHHAERAEAEPACERTA